MQQAALNARYWMVCATATTVAFGGSGQAATPPPGLYQVDREFTMSAAAYGSTYVEWTQRIEGQTGSHTVTRRAMPAGNTTTERRRGSGPVRACMRTAAPPAWLNASDCNPRNFVKASDGPQFTVDCVKSGVTQETWQRLGDTTWEHRYRVPMAPSGPNAVPAPVMAAMAPAIVQLEDRVRNGRPDEAAWARQQLAALRGADAGSETVTGKIVERWTLVAEACPRLP